MEIVDFELSPEYVHHIINVCVVIHDDAKANEISHLPVRIVVSLPFDLFRDGIQPLGARFNRVARMGGVFLKDAFHQRLKLAAQFPIAVTPCREFPEVLGDIQFGI